ncbi:pyridoxal phosphate-dependent aminotransferase [Nocardiopsis sp. MG754419]|uniref:pyridoxal phosphate-dependent aminotransferase n=1 Tax=Nocardiopsis sp. MG754419 TaxID=2259865 RepID=UPI001BAB62D0|nr:pyridoxal phosphate-dependent aminotransferase [Nocardiopsis sp. MG754419]MBR8742339.1 putative succinyldiaminopimelate transaminase DapC [Nocardiopsis sp. MG754419]
MEEPLIARMRTYGETIFAEMTRLAVETESVNLGQGFPDTDGPRSLLENASRNILEGVNQYPPGPGRPELRRAVSRYRSRHYGLDFDPDTEVYVTVGATAGIAASLLALVDHGDEVIVFEPMYDSYAAMISLAGGVRRSVALRRDAATGRFTFDPAELRAAVTPRTRLIMVNSPHNPTGTVFTAAELEEIASLCREHDLIAVTDEVYEFLTFDDHRHIPLATLAGMRERTLSISSVGKTFAVTAWKTGWVSGPEPLVRAVRTVNQFLTFSANGALQLAIADALDNEDAWVEEQRAALQGKRDRLAAGLIGAGFDVDMSEGTYFLMADIRPLGYEDGEDVARALPREAGVAAVPAKVFYDHEDEGRHLVRFAFCKRDKVLDEAVARLDRWRSEKG